MKLFYHSCEQICMYICLLFELLQAYSIEVCRPEHQALGLSIVNKFILISSQVQNSDNCISNPFHYLYIGKHWLGHRACCGSSHWRLLCTGNCFAINCNHFFTEYYNGIITYFVSHFSQPAKQYPNVFSEKSIFGRYTQMVCLKIYFINSFIIY